MNILIWKPKQQSEELQKEILEKFKDCDIDPSRGQQQNRGQGQGRQSGQRSSQTKQQKKDRKTTEIKMKMLTQTQSKNERKK